MLRSSASNPWSISGSSPRVALQVAEHAITSRADPRVGIWSATEPMCLDAEPDMARYAAMASSADWAISCRGRPCWSRREPPPLHGEVRVAALTAPPRRRGERPPGSRRGAGSDAHLGLWWRGRRGLGGATGRGVCHLDTHRILVCYTLDKKLTVSNRGGCRGASTPRTTASIPPCAG